MAELKTECIPSNIRQCNRCGNQQETIPKATTQCIKCGQIAAINCLVWDDIWRKPDPFTIPHAQPSLEQLERIRSNCMKHPFAYCHTSCEKTPYCWGTIYRVIYAYISVNKVQLTLEELDKPGSRMSAQAEHFHLLERCDTGISQIRPKINLNTDLLKLAESFIGVDRVKCKAFVNSEIPVGSVYKLKGAMFADNSSGKHLILELENANKWVCCSNAKNFEPYTEPECVEEASANRTKHPILTSNSIKRQLDAMQNSIETNNLIIATNQEIMVEVDKHQEIMVEVDKHRHADKLALQQRLDAYHAKVCDLVERLKKQRDDFENAQVTHDRAIHAMQELIDKLNITVGACCQSIMVLQTEARSK